MCVRVLFQIKIITFIHVSFWFSENENDFKNQCHFLNVHHEIKFHLIRMQIGFWYTSFYDALLKRFVRRVIFVPSESFIYVSFSIFQWIAEHKWIVSLCTQKAAIFLHPILKKKRWAWKELNIMAVWMVMCGW